ncbi:MAG: aromatic acid decarboxylase [Methanomassiliicoccales archaeon PtaB.Bin134]|nr:MAG: aromatic acid decarboxylase [Methanomassiliicoccales archaeon PtaB.Bin134]
MKTVVAITGASGTIYGIRLLEELEGEKALIVTETAKRIIEAETDRRVHELEGLADAVYHEDELFAPVASGSHRFDAMVICPCSESTLAKIASGIADNLVTRAAAVCLKERRKLIIVPRETPQSAIMLRNALRLAEDGAIIMPASPGFYPRPQTVEELVDFLVGKILDQLGQPHELFRRWGD